MKKHRIMNHPEILQSCKICHQQFMYRVSVRKHIKKAHLQFTHICTTCNDPFETKFQLLKHIEVNHDPLTSMMEQNYMQKTFENPEGQREDSTLIEEKVDASDEP